MVVGFNDLTAVERVLEAHTGQVAGMIVEPIMMNAGIIVPDPGYLAGLKDLLHAHGALLAFDEVKTGLTAGPGGATGLVGVTPDIICLAKAIGGGIVSAAVGGTAEVMAHVADGRLRDGRAPSTATRWPWRPPGPCCRRWPHRRPTSGSTACGTGPWPGSRRSSPPTGLEAHVVAVGAKGCVVFQAEPVRDYRDFDSLDDRFNHAHWLMQHNGGVFLPPWGKMEQWLISAQHDEPTSTGSSGTSSAWLRSLAGLTARPRRPAAGRNVTVGRSADLPCSHFGGTWWLNN